MIIFTAARTAEIDADPTLNKKYARIMYNNINATVTATTGAAVGTDIANVEDPLTYNFYSPANNNGTEITLDFNQSVDVDGICLIIDKPFTNKVKVGFKVFINGDYEDWDSEGLYDITDDNVLMFSGTNKVTSKLRIKFDTTQLGNPVVIRNIYAGKYLIMQRGIYVGHSPITLNRKNTIKPNISEGGQWLGRSVTRKNLTTSFDWSNLNAQWYRSNFDPFAITAASEPFYISWKPDRFPDETAYCWTTKDISPSNSGPKDFMSVSVSAQGYIA